MSTLAMKKSNMAAVGTAKKEKESLIERFKKYVLDNADYFEMASAATSGNTAQALQILRSRAR